MHHEGDKSNNSFAAFLFGAVTGSLLTLWFSPKSGKSLRNNLVDEIDRIIEESREKGERAFLDAKSYSDNLIAKTEYILTTVKKFAEGNYKYPVEKLEKEIASLKTAINAAIDTYKHGNNNFKDIEKSVSDKFKEFEDDTLPKHIGMGKGRSR